MDADFPHFDKIPRLFREATVTEKVDGTNGLLRVSEDYDVRAGSRKRWLTPAKSDDNFGFAAWAAEYAPELSGLLGPGDHYGEWYGSGIGRGYGLAKGEKRFALFNTARWLGVDLPSIGLRCVPVVYSGPFCTDTVRFCLQALEREGSRLEPGFDRPEGVVVYHHALRSYFKATILQDDAGKEAA